MRIRALLLSLPLLGCATVTLNPEIQGKKPEDMWEHPWNILHQRPADAWQCPIRDLTTKVASSATPTEAGTHSRVYEVSGCNQTMLATLTTNDTIWVLRDDIGMRKKVAFDQKGRCENYTVTYIDENTRGLEACGEKLVYVAVGNTWVVNTSR